MEFVSFVPFFFFFTFRVHDEYVVLVHESFFQAWPVRFALAWVAAVLDVDRERRARHRHVVVTYVYGVRAFLERHVTYAIRAVALQCDHFLGRVPARIVDPARNFVHLVFPLSESSRVHCEFRCTINARA